MVQPFLEFKDKTLKEIELLANCPVCQSQFYKNNALIVYNNGESLFIHIDCLECLGSFIVTVKRGVSDSKNSITVSMTDLTKDDIVHFKGKPDLTMEEILNLHLFFKNDYTL